MNPPGDHEERCLVDVLQGKSKFNILLSYLIVLFWGGSPYFKIPCSNDLVLLSYQSLKS